MVGYNITLIISIDYKWMKPSQRTFTKNRQNTDTTITTEFLTLIFFILKLRWKRKLRSREEQRIRTRDICSIHVKL